MKKFVSKRITVSLTEDLATYLDQLSNKLTLSQSDIVRSILIAEMNKGIYSFYTVNSD